MSSEDRCLSACLKCRRDTFVLSLADGAPIVDLTEPSSIDRRGRAGRAPIARSLERSARQRRDRCADKRLERTRPEPGARGSSLMGDVRGS